MKYSAAFVAFVTGAMLVFAVRAYSESCGGCNPNTNIESANDPSQCLTVEFGAGHKWTPGWCTVTPPCDPVVPCELEVELIFKKGSSQVCAGVYGDICVVDPQGNETCSNGTRISYTRHHTIPCGGAKTTVVGKLKSLLGTDATLKLDFSCSDCVPVVGG